MLHVLHAVLTREDCDGMIIAKYRRIALVIETELHLRSPCEERIPKVPRCARCEICQIQLSLESSHKRSLETSFFIYSCARIWCLAVEWMKCEDQEELDVSALHSALPLHLTSDLGKAQH